MRSEVGNLKSKIRSIYFFSLCDFAYIVLRSCIDVISNAIYRSYCNYFIK